MPSKAARGYLSQLVFGTSDGLLAALAITLAVGSKGRGAVLLALFAVFIAGACGMPNIPRSGGNRRWSWGAAQEGQPCS
jgi:hypothetical protein